MSLSLVQVPVAKVIVPTIDIGARKEYVIAKGAKENTWQVFSAQNLNANQINITSNPPSRKHIINRRAFVRASYQFVISGTAGAGGKMIQPGLDAPRQYPIAQTLNTLQASINNDNYSVTLNQYWNALLRYHHKNSEAQFNSLTPSYLDAYQEYTDFLNPQFGGSGKNALGGYGEVSDGDGGASAAGGRGGFPWVIVSDTGGSATVTMTSVEPIFMPPFNFSEEESNGFIGVENMSFTFTFGELASQLWSHDNLSAGHSTITNIAVTLTGFDVLLNFQTLPIDMTVPDQAVYPYFEITPYSTPAVTIAAGSSQTIVMNSVQLKSIPHRMYIFAQENQNDMLFANGGINKTNTFAPINSINITFNNKVGLLSTATKEELYAIAQNNGCNLSWPAWSKYVGSVMAINPSKDLSLSESEASGLIGNYQLGMQVNVTNTHTASLPYNPGRSVNYVLWVVVINEGTMSIVNGSVSHQIGVFSERDVLNAPIDRSLSWKKTEHIYGGDFLGIGNFFKHKVAPALVKGYNWVKDNKLISRGLRMIPHPNAQRAAMVADQIGLGVSKHKRKRHKGGVLVGEDNGMMLGGAMISRDQLSERLGGDMEGGDMEGGDMEGGVCCNSDHSDSSD